MSQFPHLTQYDHPHSELYQSKEVHDSDTSMPAVMDYQVDVDDKDIILQLKDGVSYCGFILNKEHIPFLEQLLNDLKEVTK